MLRDIASPQRKVRVIDFRIDGTGTASITAGSAHISLTDNGTGDYTVTLTKPGARLLFAAATPVDTDTFAQIDISDSSASAVNFVFKNDSGSATDTEFFGIIMVSDATLET